MLACCFSMCGRCRLAGLMALLQIAVEGVSETVLTPLLGAGTFVEAQGPEHVARALVQHAG